jgi:hypothetical protein
VPRPAAQDAFFRFLVCVEDGLFGGLLAGDQLLPACAATAHLNATVVAECADGAQGAGSWLPAHAGLVRLRRVWHSQSVRGAFLAA